MALQKWQHHRHFFCIGITVLWWVPRQNGGCVYWRVTAASQPDGGQHFVQQCAGASCKHFSGAVIIAVGCVGDDHDGCACNAARKDQIARDGLERASLKRGHGRTQSGKVLGRICGIARGADLVNFGCRGGNRRWGGRQRGWCLDGFGRSLDVLQRVAVDGFITNRLITAHFDLPVEQRLGRPKFHTRFHAPL